MFEKGLIVGKFCPLHKGHEYLIAQAKAQCQQLYILSYTQPEFPGYGPERRRQWLKGVAWDAKILVLDPDPNTPANDAADDVQRKFTARTIDNEWGLRPDAVFTSEAYGDGFAAFLSGYFQKSVKHVSIDPKRASIPISGTEIRKDIHANRKYLSPYIYSSFVETVCFLGAESTGKSTLSSTLAQIYETEHVDEYGRTLWMEKDGDLTFSDYMHIAITHIGNENAAHNRSNRYVFIDTSPLTTYFYALEHFGRADQQLIGLSHRPYDYIFLCHPDFPMVQDGWRSDEKFRRRQHEWYLKILKERNIAYTDLKGSFDDKINQVKYQLSRPRTPG